MSVPGRLIAFCLLACPLVWLPASSPAQTPSLSELRQIVSAHRASFDTASVVYVEQLDNLTPLPGDPNDPAYRLMLALRNKNRRIEATVNARSRLLKIKQTDIQDFNLLISKFRLPADAKVRLCDSGAALVFGPYELQLSGPGCPGRSPELNIVRNRTAQKDLFDLPYLGVVKTEWLDPRCNPSLAPAPHADGALLRIEASDVCDPPHAKAVIDCDPNLAFRFRSVRFYLDDRLVREIIADQFTNVGDNPYPFVYTTRDFDQAGKLSCESIRAIEQVRLAIDVPRDIFKLFIPAGTDVNDPVFNRKRFTIDRSADMTIDDIRIAGAKLPPKRP